MRLLFRLGDTYLDTYEGEQVNITSTLKDLSEIDAQVSPFTKEFNVPATRTNNEAFKHWYDVGIFGGFDAHQAVDSLLIIDDLIQIKGVTELKQVNMDKLNPDFYTIAFYGDVRRLRSIFGEDLMDSIDVTKWDHDLTYANIQSSWAGTLFSGNVLYPLFAFMRPWKYTNQPTNPNVLDAINTNAGAISVGELRPSYNYREFIKAIFEEYGQVATGTFFDSSEDDRLGDLFILPMKSSGYYENAEERFESLTNVTHASIALSAFSGLSTPPQLLNINAAGYDPLGDWDIVNDRYTTRYKAKYTFEYTIDLSSNPTISNGPFVIFQELNGTIQSVTSGVYRIITPTSTSVVAGAFTLDLDLGDQVRFYIQSQDSTNGATVSGSFRITKIEGNNGGDSVVWPQVVPAKSIMEFISGVQKFHNLIILPGSKDNEWRFEFFEDWLQAGDVMKFDNYVDIETVNSKKVDIPKTIAFKHQTSEDMPNAFFRDSFKREFGAIRYNPEVDFATNDFMLETIFTIFPIQRLRVFETDLETNLEIIFMIDEDLKEVQADYILFYYTGNKTVLNYKMLDETGVIQSLATMPIVRPFADNPTVTDSYSLAFGLELSFDKVVPVRTAYQEYYQDTFERFYNRQTRIITCKGYLPLSQYVELELNTSIFFYDHYWKIREFKYNPETEEFTCELITFAPVRFPRVSEISPNGDVVADLALSGSDFNRLNVERLGSGAVMKRNFPGISQAFKTNLQSNYLMQGVVVRGGAYQVASDLGAFSITTSPTFTTFNKWDDTLYEQRKYVIGSIPGSTFTIQADGQYSINHMVVAEFADFTELLVIMYINGSATPIQHMSNSKYQTVKFDTVYTFSQGDLITFEWARITGSNDPDIVSAYLSIKYENDTL